MNEEQNMEQQGKSATYRRANRHGRNRPVLVTDAATEQTADVEVQETATSAPAAPTMTEEAPAVKSRPKFFSTVGKKEEAAETKSTDAAAARLARAVRGKAAVPGKKEPKETKAARETGEPKKPEPKAVVKSAPARSAPPRRGGFKPRHLIGILIYLVVADFVGSYERAFLVSYGLDRPLFSIGSIVVSNSTITFLLTLVILLVILARFDLVPRSLTPAPAKPQGKTGAAQTTDTDFRNTGNAPPMKKGVQGKDDDLYQEYRETQRYLQRRERKK